jgi:hypothetical protein
VVARLLYSNCTALLRYRGARGVKAALGVMKLGLQPVQMNSLVDEAGQPNLWSPVSALTVNEKSVHTNYMWFKVIAALLDAQAIKLAPRLLFKELN